MGPHRRPLAAIGFVMALLVLLTGCAGKLRLSGKTMCEAHGGSYSAQTKQCSYPAQQPPRNITQVCQAHGGTYDPIGEDCVLDYP